MFYLFIPNGTRNCPFKWASNTNLATVSVFDFRWMEISFTQEGMHNNI